MMCQTVAQYPLPEYSKFEVLVQVPGIDDTVNYQHGKASVHGPESR